MQAWDEVGTHVVKSIERIESQLVEISAEVHLIHVKLGAIQGKHKAQSAIIGSMSGGLIALIVGFLTKFLG